MEVFCMCGIVGYVGKRNAQDVLLDGLEKLEYRGYDSAGVALALEGGIRVVKSKGRLAELRKRLAVEALARSGCGIGHTRWATHGEPSDVNSHPHSTPRVSIVHNGIIENYGVLKERLMAKGYTFESETDTEVLVKLIDSCYEGEPLKALRAALAMVRGSYALAVLFRDFPDTLFAVKRESPLIVGWGEEENFIASDIPALLKYTRRYSVLEEGDMAVVNADGIRFYNEFAEPVEREVLTANWDQEAAEKGGYPHFMLKEINEQPAAITATVSPRVENGLPDLRVPELTDERLRRIGTVHLVGCGTAMHAGMVGKAAIEALARVPAQVEIASEFRYRNPILRPEDLVIIISQSGETSDTLAALKLAKSRGVPVLAIVNVVGSSIARAADYVMYTYAGPEIAVASTKAYMVQMCVLYLFALRLAYARGMQTDAEIRRLTAELLRAGEVIKPRLADCEQIKYLASRFVNTQSCFFIGRGFDYSLSLEGSLKLKEISYVHSDAYAAGELKHGTISLVTDGVPVIALATQKQVYEKTISNAKETKSRGAKVLLFTTRDAVVPDGVADYVVRLDDYDDLLMPLQLIVPLQLFAYYMAVLRGCDVDKPRNLAKSVTVE
ncbi:glutamine--fructose-6-phosphate transaminase (isomerizing) [Faecalibacterium prausnitzii]|jgi:glucosamine--fructose-6-phosphate aminotransferase (isomerizing)|uniref:Glutamine--fructose-6-phosphate aminotransferase [isomerizing] n=2 Tax=Faecalibacterium TaxID=216851 RepID=A0A291TE74_9FIRM|nr:glutamine--fructose-6-phosphate transaminase (isomerizing) [Faecalibacterium prausnitzii]MCI3216991.1 glutamine--fructose-6-phosphate transaminase (isomerizing) [Faecalibacterium sp. BCRC 81149]MBD9046897.1 glutamine--fructose-6-phosphate transaminase (isomerizing) [Faecalibacterium prausnitzii]MBT9691085.1 glutamine--fructose-6-phosphate transaminase (isomerizing) [Faecalibacterium prausnitzii]MSC62308.1 glutamine--fructose-6-phosphate transaminase (isomerizing) [Faecalibacterium prausnitzi